MSTSKLHIQVNAPAPDFQLQAHTGQTIKLSDYQGQKVVLFFVRTYNCYTCRQHVEHLGRVYQDFQGQGAQILVLLHADMVSAQGYAEVTRAPFPILADPKHEVYEAFGLDRVFMFSTRTGSVVIDEAGKVSYIRTMTNPWGWRNEIENLLGHLQAAA
jgi:peroxiredoxin Q/BCP